MPIRRKQIRPKPRPRKRRTAPRRPNPRRDWLIHGPGTGDLPPAEPEKK